MTQLSTDNCKPTWQVHQDALIQQLQQENKNLNEKIVLLEEKMETFVSNTLNQRLTEISDLLEIKWKNKVASLTTSIQKSLEV